MRGSTGTSSLGGLLRSAGGPPGAVLHRVLVLACELLDMDAAYVTVLDRSSFPVTRTVVRAVSRDGQELTGAAGLTEPLAESWCGPVVSEGSALVDDVQRHLDLQGLPSTAAFGIVSHAGAAVPDLAGGPVVGTLCVLGHRPHPSLNERDAAVLRTLALETARVLPSVCAPATSLPVPESALEALGVEDLTRPLLEALHEVTRLGSTYLTQIHADREEQEIRLALNTREGFEIPAGLQVPWTDTLCRRALEEGRACTTDVPAVWGDSEAAAALGIQVYVSVPVELADGQVWGTLCAADSLPAEQVDQHLPMMRTFSRLIAAEVDRSLQIASHLDRSAVRAERARLVADTDELTGCARRHLVEPWIADALATAGGGDEVVVAFLDIDDFKPINDSFGHATGDAVLVEVARRLRRGLRHGDLLARYGGDEFLVAAVVPAGGLADVLRRLNDFAPLVVRVDGHDLGVGVSVGIAHQPGGHAAPAAVDLVARADRAMYDVKRARSLSQAAGAPSPRKAPSSSRAARQQ